MMIREIEKTHAPRKNKEVTPLRKSALGLGVFLKGLSDTVQSAKKRKNDDADTLETPYSGASRTFKLKSAKNESEQASPLPFKLNFNDEQTFVLNILKEMRKLAADASQNILSEKERDDSAARFQTIFGELEEKYPKTFASLQEDETKEPLSVSTHQSAASAFLNIEEMIVKFFEIGAQQQGGKPAAKNADPLNSDLKTALNASGHIKELFMNEGSARTFGRFQEIDRNNVLGLLK